jgi:hypothetical protein
MHSSDYLQGIHQKVLDHVDSRDGVAGLDWLESDEEPLRFLSMNVERKARVISSVIEKGLEKERQEGLLDAILDLLGYSYGLYYRVEKL